MPVLQKVEMRTQKFKASLSCVKSCPKKGSFGERGVPQILCDFMDRSCLEWASPQTGKTVGCQMLGTELWRTIISKTTGLSMEKWAVITAANTQQHSAASLKTPNSNQLPLWKQLGWFTSFVLYIVCHNETRNKTFLACVLPQLRIYTKETLWGGCREDMEHLNSQQ